MSRAVLEDVDPNIGEEVVWTEVEQDSDDEDGELEENDEEDFIAIRSDLIEKVHYTVNTKWRDKGENCNVRGAGTSRRTYFREQAKKTKLSEAALQCKSLFDMRTWRNSSVAVNSAVNNEEISLETAVVGDDGFDMFMMCQPCENVKSSLSPENAILLLLESENRYVSKSVNKQNSLTEFERRRRLAVCRYLQLMIDGDSTGLVLGKMKASQAVAFMLFGKKDEQSYKARCIRQWADEFCLNGELSTYKYGERTKTKSVITDEDFSWTCKEYLRSMPDNARTPSNFMTHLNETLLPTIQHGPASISLSTATRWMRYLGFNLIAASKGWFTDGHERVDVVAHREEFIKQMEDIEKGMPLYDSNMDEIEAPSQSMNGKKKVVITHDESTFYCNEGKKFFWMENGKRKLLPKSAGKSIMVSGFTCPCHGFMTVTREWKNGIRSKRVSYQLFEAGIAREGWFTCKDVVAQVNEYAELFEFLHPSEEYDVFVIFDNSMTHHAKPPGGLDAFALNKSDGGAKIKHQKDTWFIDKDTQERRVQKMQFISDDGRTVQKGLERILRERGLYHTELMHPHLLLQCVGCSSADNKIAQFAKGEQCCCRAVMRRQPDFMEQKEWLEETVTSHGFHILFYPKYHCELNFIEYIWGWVKSYHRRNCTYNYNDLKANIGNTMENIIPLATIRKYWRYCQRFFTGYRVGLTGPLLGYTVKKYTGHRAIPKLVVNELNNMAVGNKLPQNLIHCLAEMNALLAEREMNA